MMQALNRPSKDGFLAATGGGIGLVGGGSGPRSVVFDVGLETALMLLAFCCISACIIASICCMFFS